MNSYTMCHYLQVDATPASTMYHFSPNKMGLTLQEPTMTINIQYAVFIQLVARLRFTFLQVVYFNSWQVKVITVASW